MPIVDLLILLGDTHDYLMALQQPILVLVKANKDWPDGPEAHIPLHLLRFICCILLSGILLECGADDYSTDEAYEHNAYQD